MKLLIYNTKLQKFNDGKFIFIGGLSRLNRHYGWYRGKSFIVWLEKIIAAKTANPDITFRELHNKKFKDLYVTGTSLNHQKLIVFSYETYPDMKVADAVRISMSIPLYFEAVFIDSMGRISNRNKLTEYYDIMVDGGFTANFPLNRSALTSDDWKRTVSVSSGTIGPKIRRLSVEEKNTLITNGTVAMKSFLQSH